MLAGRTLILLAATTILGGCVVWKSDYDAVKAQNAQLQQQVEADRAQIKRLQGAITYTINSDLLFAPGSWEMNPNGQEIIAKFADRLAAQQISRLLVTSYTDNAPIGARLRAEGVDSNQALSEKRAQAVRDFLISRGVNPSLVAARGMGEADPVASNSTPAGREQNRRVVLSVPPA